jgi:succinoglycan biosynthesis transport protein ExoP
LLSRISRGTSVADSQLQRLAASDPVVAQLEGQLDANQAEIEDLAKDEKRLQAAIDEAQRHLSLMPAREQQLAGMTRELDALNEEIKGVAKMQQPSELAADMEKRQEGQRFRQLDPANLPLKPTSPDRLKISLGAMVGGLVLGFALAFLKERWNPTFHTEKELRQRFSPPFVIAVPLLATPAETRKRGWTAGFEWAAGSALTAAMLAIEFYVYKHR